VITSTDVADSGVSSASEGRTSGLFAGFVEREAPAVPLPGRSTSRRFAVLSALGRRELSLARLAEGHLDAAATLHEVDGSLPERGERWGVWAARPPSPVVNATRTGAGWRLSGLKPYCSGARSCTHALVTAEADDGYRLFAVVLDHPGMVPVPGTWPAIGMADSDSLDVSFTDVPARDVGGPGAYVERPGFLQGGVGVAACWLGGAQAVAAPLYERSDAGRLNDHAAAHLGAVDVLLSTAGTVMRQAAEDIDADPLTSTGRPGYVVCGSGHWSRKCAPKSSITRGGLWAPVRSAMTNAMLARWRT
jgi:alkylation response protein AidB-like acyl-CoA dehydrogenase